jgi:uncharacterized protein (DUF1778 family)
MEFDERPAYGGVAAVGVEPAMAVRWPYISEEPIMATPARRRDRRLGVRTTAEERALIDRAAAAAGTDLTSFVVTRLTDAARRVLADRDRFTLSPEAAAEWERINQRPAEELAGLRRLMQRPSPFAG